MLYTTDMQAQREITISLLNKLQTTVAEENTALNVTNHVTDAILEDR